MLIIERKLTMNITKLFLIIFSLIFMTFNMANALDSKPSITLDIAKKVSEGKVTGLDISVPMLNQAKSEATAQGLTNDDFKVVDVQVDQLTNEQYDCVYSRFGVMFFEDPFEAFKNIFTSVKGGGKLSFVCWQDPALNPWQSLSIKVIKEYLDIPSPPKRSPGPFAFQEQNA